MKLNQVELQFSKAVVYGRVLCPVHVLTQHGSYRGELLEATSPWHVFPAGHTGL